MDEEITLIAEFMVRNKRDRYREILASPRLRHKFTGNLAHFKDFAPEYRLPIHGNKLSQEKIAIELTKRNSPDSVFLLSEDSDLDQKWLPLREALSKVVGCGIGAFLSCIPGRLAFVETEDERFILER